MKLTGKIAVVTGAARGIGAAIAERLLADGADIVAMLDVNQESIEEAAKKLDPSGKKAIPYVCNVADKANVDAVFADILEKFQKVDILVNNAGITRDAMFHKMTQEQWDLVIDVNLNGVAYCTQAVIPTMRQNNYGKIVNYASVSAFGNIGQTNYGATKAAIIGFTKCLAKEVARNNITVNAIAPSYVKTEMLLAVPEQVMQKFVAAVPMGRLAEPSELASATSFLCSDDSSFITGHCLVVSGGSHT